MAQPNNQQGKPKVIKQIDDGLAIYYRFRGVHDYYDEDGMGKFQEWADTNDMDSEGIVEDLEEDEPFSVDFDDNFPLVNQEENRIKQIRDILHKCLKKKNPIFGKVFEFPNLTKAFFTIDPKDVHEMKQKYSNQCASIMNEGMSDDGGLFEIITAGHKNGYDEYIQHLADTYSRDRIAYYLEYLEQKDSEDCVPTLDENIWSHLDNSPLFNQINAFEESLSAVTKTKTAIKSFYKRLVPKLLLSGNKKIQDSVEHTASIIVTAALFVHDLIKQEQTFPFQIDVSIGYKGAREQNEDAVPNGSTEDDDDDDVDDTDIYGDTKDDDTQGFYDCIGDVEAKLKVNGLTYVKHTINPDHEEKKFGLGASHRPFTDPFDRLKQKSNVSKSMIGTGTYPQRKRINIFVDRRGEDPNVDTIYMFEPPDNCKYIPVDAAALWYLSASRAALIPDMEYDGDMVDATNAVSPHVCQFVKEAEEEKTVNTGTHYWCTLAKCIAKEEVMDGMEFDLVVQVRQKYYTIKVRRENHPSMNYKLIGNPVETKFDPSQQRVDKNTIRYDTVKKKLQNQNITSNNHCKGGILTVSFHAIEADRIKCYLYFNGQVTRFMPERDIKDVLPLLFDEKYDEDNGIWSQGNVVNGFIDALSNTIIDREFEAFYNKYRSVFKRKKKNDNFIN